jgi:hypothetical protein
MNSTDFDDYVVEFNCEWAAIDHSRWEYDAIYLGKWSDKHPEKVMGIGNCTIPDDAKVLKDIRKPSRIIHYYKQDNLPDPQMLALFLDEYLWRLSCNRVERDKKKWELTTFMQPSPKKKKGRLVFRIPIGLSVYGEFSTGNMFLKVLCRCFVVEMERPDEH